ncbi:MAG: helix-turn-helix transcriptional regulator [Eubacteriales bacterium]|nr:helix-turn-helix transcriptional regulator [Eubacteriales bacterium]
MRVISEANYKKLINYIVTLASTPDPMQSAIKLLYFVVPYDAAVYLDIGDFGELRNVFMDTRDDPRFVAISRPGFYINDPVFDFGHRASGMAISRTTRYETEKTDSFRNHVYPMRLKEAGITEFVAFNSENNGSGIRLFRTDASQPFSEEELEICEIVADVLRHRMSGFIGDEIAARNNYIDSLVYEMLTFGIVLYDEEFKVLRFNNLAIHRISCITKKTLFSEAMEAFAAEVKKHVVEMKRRQLNIQQTMVQEDYILEVLVYNVLDSEGNIKTYYPVSIFSSTWFRSFLTASISSLFTQYSLTEREKAVVELVIKGYRNNEIAEELHISINTVKEHFKNIFRKMEVRNRGEMMIKIFSI